MTLEETMHAIEQEQFVAEMSLAAGTKAFGRAIRKHELFKTLSDLALGKPEEVSCRIDAICRLQVDERYENRFDAALSAYVMALSDAAETAVVQEAAQTILKTPKCWWAAGIARELLLETIAIGAIGAGVDWRDAIYVRVNEWLTAVHPMRETTTRELLKAVSAGQPAGQRNKVIEFPSQEQRLRHHHVVPKSLIKRRQRVPSTGKTRRRA